MGAGDGFLVFRKLKDVTSIRIGKFSDLLEGMIDFGINLIGIQVDREGVDIPLRVKQTIHGLGVGHAAGGSNSCKRRGEEGGDVVERKVNDKVASRYAIPGYVVWNRECRRLAIQIVTQHVLECIIAGEER